MLTFIVYVVLNYVRIKTPMITVITLNFTHPTTSLQKACRTSVCSLHVFYLVIHSNIITWSKSIIACDVPARSHMGFTHFRKKDEGK